MTDKILLTLIGGFFSFIIFGLIYKTTHTEPPKMIQEVEGCRIYSFYAEGDTHYFTRCPSGDKTSTERHYTQSCGKACVINKKEVVTNEEAPQ